MKTAILIAAMLLVSQELRAQYPNSPTPGFNQGYQQMNQALSTLAGQWAPQPTRPMQRMPTQTNPAYEQAQQRYWDTLRENQSDYSNPMSPGGYCKTRAILDSNGNIVRYKRQCF